MKIQMREAKSLCPESKNVKKLQMWGMEQGFYSGIEAIL